MRGHWQAVWVAGLMAATAAAADWPQWRGPTRDGISTETGWLAQWPAGGPKQLWKADVGMGCSSVSVSQGRLFTQGNKDDTDTVYAFDAVGGKLLWNHSYACPLAPKYYHGGTSATPTVDGDRVYTISKEGHLFCLQADSGKVVWSKHLQKDLGGVMPTWGYAGSVLILGKQALLDVGAPGAGTVAFDKLTGDVLWKHGADKAGYSTLLPFEFGGKTWLADFNGFGLVVRATDGGAEMARYRWKTSYECNAAMPVIAGDRIFISSGYNSGCALLQLKTGGLSLLWQNKKMRNHFNSCVLWKGALYGFDDDKLACMDFATGEEKWRQEGLGKGSLMLADGKLIIQSDKGDLAIAEASPAAYKEISRTHIFDKQSWVVPVLANGRIYAKNDFGSLVCLDVGGK